MSVTKGKEKAAKGRRESCNVVGVGYGRKKARERDDRVLTVLVKDKGSVPDCPQLAAILGSPDTEILEVGEIVALPKSLGPR